MMRRSDLWCPYCQAYAATWDGNELRCGACGRIAQLDYGYVVAEYGPDKARRVWERKNAGAKQMTLGWGAA
jgi:glutaredoxin